MMGINIILNNNRKPQSPILKMQLIMYVSLRISSGDRVPLAVCQVLYMLKLSNSTCLVDSSNIFYSTWLTYLREGVIGMFGHD